MDMIELSAEPSAMRDLTESQKERLATLVEQYLSGMEQGLPPEVESLAADDPDLADALQDCVAGLENLHRLVAGVDPAVKRAEFALDPRQRRLGDFALQEEIGRGGMGVVYRAHQISLDRYVAIKLLPLASVLDSRQIARFRNEAQAAAGLHHPHIVPVYAVGCERGVHFYAMQLIDGQSMDHVIAANHKQPSTSEVEPTDWKTGVMIAVQAAEALHAAHEFGVIHRDVKPSNLILDADGKTWVTDFGLARCQTEVSLTGSGDVVGTMKYMSPEQARGESALVDGRTDVYSLGATLYEMLTLPSACDLD